LKIEFITTHLDDCALLNYQETSENFIVCTCQKKLTNMHNMDAVLLHLHRNIYHFYTPEIMAEKIGYSKRHFIRLFKRYIGVNYGKYNNLIRVEKVGNQLIETEFPIGTIAQNVGLNHKQICNLFQKHLKLSPSEFRKKYQTQNDNI
jgi:transcriptional regulator GlxA family with amidase domain